VGTSVGDTVGALLGEAEGAGVGLPTDVKIRVTDAVMGLATLIVIWLLAALTDTTVTVDEVMFVPTTVLPTVMAPVMPDVMLTTLEPAVMSAVPTTTVPADK